MAAGYTSKWCNFECDYTTLDKIAGMFFEQECFLTGMFFDRGVFNKDL